MSIWIFIIASLAMFNAAAALTIVAAGKDRPRTAASYAWDVAGWTLTAASGFIVLALEA